MSYGVPYEMYLVFPNNPIDFKLYSGTTFKRSIVYQFNYTTPQQLFTFKSFDEWGRFFDYIGEPHTPYSNILAAFDSVLLRIRPYSENKARLCRAIHQLPISIPEFSDGESDFEQLQEYLNFSTIRLNIPADIVKNLKDGTYDYDVVGVFDGGDYYGQYYPPTSNVLAYGLLERV